MFSTPGLSPVASHQEAIDADGSNGQARGGKEGSEAVMDNPASTLTDDEPLPPPELVIGPLPSSELIERLYRSESPRLLRSLSRSAGNPDDAQDLLQEIFFRLARMGQQVTRLERPQAYLKRIAANLAKDRSKLAMRRHYSLHVVADEEYLAGADPTRLLESRDMLNRIEAAMMQLRPRTREIFMAHRIDGMSYGEIAELTGLSIKGVEKQMSKALQQIDRMLGGS
jgi:RNA polymerase sigma factor (sigma-70 family)